MQLLRAQSAQIPKAQKKTDNLAVFFVGSACVKAARRTFMKLIPIVNFTNILSTAFVLPDPKSEKRH